MKFYVHAFINSLHRFDWLAQQKNNNKKAANYAILLIFIASIVNASFSAFLAQKNALSFIEEFDNNTPDFSVVMQDGVLQVDNLPQPFKKEFQFGEDTFTIVVDTVTTSSIELSDVINTETQSALLVTRDFMTMYDHVQGESQTDHFSVISQNDTLQKSDVIKNVKNLLGNSALVFVATLLAFFVGNVLKYLVVSLLFVALLIYLIARMRKHDGWTFKQLYITSLFACTTPVLLGYVARLLHITIPFLFIILTFVMMYIVVFQTKQKENADTEEKKLEKVDEIDSVVI